MKKIIVTIAIAAFLVNSINAQDNKTDYREKFVFGVKVGANLSNVYDSEGEEFNTDPKLGLATGAFFSIPIGKYIGVQPEILFSQKGFQATGKLFNNSYAFTRTTSFIDVPLLFAIKPSSFVTILAGPQYSYLIHQRDKFSYSTTSTQEEKEFSNDNVRKNMLCLTGGLDININHLVIGARAGWDVQRNNGDGTSSTPRYKNVWYQATVGLRF